MICYSFQHSNGRLNLQRPDPLIPFFRRPLSSLDCQILDTLIRQYIRKNFCTSTRAENGSGGPRAGPGLKIPIFPTGRAGPGRAELPKFRPGLARPGSFPVGRVVCRGLCLALPFPSV
jgi:hypothetical protein